MLRISIVLGWSAWLLACASGRDSGIQNTGPAETAPEVLVAQQQVVVSGLTFDVRTAGPEEGVPVLLLHGFGQTSYEWMAQLRALAAAGYRVAAPDQRGYSQGARPEGAENYTVAAVVQDALGIAETLGFSRYHVVGHDWGATVAWVIAAFAADRVLSLTAISVPHPDAFYAVLGDPDSCQPEASAYIQDFIAEGAEQRLLSDGARQLRELYHGLSTAQQDYYLNVFDEPEELRGGLNWYRANMASGEPPPKLGPVTVPTLFIWGDGDSYLCRDGAELTADYVDGPYLFEVLHGVGHWVPDTAADQVNTLLLRHLAEHAPR